MRRSSSTPSVGSRAAAAAPGPPCSAQARPPPSPGAGGGALTRSTSAGALSRKDGRCVWSSAVWRRDRGAAGATPPEAAAVLEFADWAQSGAGGWARLHDMFAKECENPAGGHYHDYGSRGARGVPRSRWVDMLASMGLRSEQLASQVFEEIAREGAADVRRGRLELGAQIPEEPAISFAQLKRFERRCVAAATALEAEHENSCTAQLLRRLRQSRGSVLRAWRLDLDKRGGGRVAFTDFRQGCKELGLASLGQAVWSALRQESRTPLELHELDPKAAEGLEELARALWDTVGLDLRKAWLHLDVNKQNFLTYEEFRAGMKHLGFAGDARALFRGLDAAGLGRLSREDLEYVRKVSRLAQNKFGGVAPVDGVVKDLIEWVQRELGGAQELFARIGLSPGQEAILVTDLAARLTALGFEGNALRAASLLARGEGGTSLSTVTLLQAMSGGRPRPSVQPVPGSGRRARSAPCTPRAGYVAAPAPGGAVATIASGEQLRRWLERGVWCDSVDDKSEQNTHRCSYLRGYFTPVGKLDEKRSPGVAASTPSSVSIRSTARQPEARSARPAWNDDCCQSAGRANQRYVSSHHRRYFSNFDDKPIREERRLLLERRRQAKLQELAESY